MNDWSGRVLSCIYELEWEFWDVVIFLRWLNFSLNSRNSGKNCIPSRNNIQIQKQKIHRYLTQIYTFPAILNNKAFPTHCINTKFPSQKELKYPKSDKITFIKFSKSTGKYLPKKYCQFHMLIWKQSFIALAIVDTYCVYKFTKTRVNNQQFEILTL
jgi:hypothetical protein